MNQGKLEVVKQEMARVNIDILGISELIQRIYYCGQKSPRRNGAVLIANKSLKCSIWVQFQNYSMISVHFQGKP